jgi:hypothetical protein
MINFIFLYILFPIEIKVKHLIFRKHIRKSLLNLYELIDERILIYCYIISWDLEKVIINLPIKFMLSIKQTEQLCP